MLIYVFQQNLIATKTAAKYKTLLRNRNVGYRPTHYL